MLENSGKLRMFDDDCMPRACGVLRAWITYHFEILCFQYASNVLNYRSEVTSLVRLSIKIVIPNCILYFDFPFEKFLNITNNNKDSIKKKIKESVVHCDLWGNAIKLNTSKVLSLCKHTFFTNENLQKKLKFWMSWPKAVHLRCNKCNYNRWKNFIRSKAKTSLIR